MNKKLKNKKLSILVCSYDKVHDVLELWDNYTFNNFKELIKKYKIYYGLNFSNKKNSKLINKNILFSNTLDWGLSMQIWLNQIESKYLLILLDDQLIKKLSISKLEKIINDVTNENIKFASISYGVQIIQKFINNKIVFKGQIPISKYSINLQPAIWEKRFLKKILKNVKNPWEFELNSSILYNKKFFKSFYYITKDIVFFEQYVERGKIYPKRFFKIFKDNSKRLSKRYELEKSRRIWSHIGYIYKLCKELLNVIKTFLYKKINYL